MATTVTDRSMTGNDFSVFTSPQTVKGTIDSNPVFTPVRRTEGKGMKTVAYTTSGMVKTDRQARSQVQDSIDLTAEISTEVTKDAINFMIGAIHATENVVSGSDTTIAATATGFTDVNDGFTSVEAGDFVWIGGFLNSDLNRVYYVSSKVDDGEILTEPAPAATEAAGETVTFDFGKSVSGSDPTYYALQTRGTDLSKPGELDYHTIYDGIINTQNMEIGETGIVTSTLNMLFEREVPGTSLISGQTDAPEATDAPVSAVNGIQDFYVNNATAKCVVKSLSIEINNNYQTDEAAACSKRYGYGDLEVTGSINVRSPISDPFEWRDYNWDGQRVEIGVRLDHGDGDETVIVLRQVVITELTMADGSNVISSSEASFAAEESETYGTTIEIFRNWT